MSTHLITGFAGKEHITSADQGSFNAAVMGGGEFVLERGEQFRCQVISNNKVRIYDGDAMMQGRHIIIDRNTYEETTHENGTQGYKRIDLIVLTYEKNAVSSVESVKLEVIKGSPSESDPSVPEYTTGDILNSGASKNQMPLYQIPFDGLSIGEPVKLFSTVTTLETMKKEVEAEVDAKKEEIDDKFKSMIASNAEDWSMIENHGEYTADAKTVGEEFAKVNESLEANDVNTAATSINCYIVGAGSVKPHNQKVTEYLAFLTYEFTPSAIDHNYIFAWGLLPPTTPFFLTLPMINGQNIPCMITSNGELRAYYPQSGITPARVDFSMIYPIKQK